jgi:hypothetical protein
MQALFALVAQIQHNKIICICCANTTHKAHFLRYTCSMQYVNTHTKTQSAKSALCALLRVYNNAKNVCNSAFLCYTYSMQNATYTQKQNAQNVRVAQMRVCCVAATVHKCDFFKQVQNIFACVTCFAVNVCYNAFTAAQKRSTVTRTVYVFSKLML